MLQFLAKIINPLVRSIFVSAVMFVIFFSIITGTFPPDFSRLGKTYESLQQMQAIRDVHTEPGQSPHEGDEADVHLLESYNRKRSEVAEGLMASGGGVLKTRPTEGITVGGAISKAEFQELQVQVFRLQQRVNELEDELQSKRGARD